MPAPLVLLHGFTQTRHSWDPVLAALDGRARAMAPDLPGHGSAAARPASFAACTGYVRALADERIALCGYSMGGRIALTAALALGARVERLVLVGASPGIADPAEREQRRVADERAGGADRRDSASRRSPTSGARSRCSPASRRRSPPRRAPTGCATRRRGSRPRCAASAPA